MGSIPTLTELPVEVVAHNQFTPFGTEGGLSHYWMKEATMFMHRSEGIQAGLNVLLSRLGLQ